MTKVQKVKYPRTFHFPSSPGAASDDKVALKQDVSSLKNTLVRVTEKMDGENTTMSSSFFHARSLDSWSHPSRSVVKGLWGGVRHLIPDDVLVCGENLFAKHSIPYADLEAFFLVFNVWKNDLCLSTADTDALCAALSFKPVPLIYEGVFYSEQQIFSLWQDYCKDLPRPSEGFVVRTVSAFERDSFSQNVFKYVRENHISTLEHWASTTIVPNSLIKA